MRLGVNSCIRKPATFNKLVDVVATLDHYWLGIMKLPPDADCVGAVDDAMR